MTSHPEHDLPPTHSEFLWDIFADRPDRSRRVAESLVHSARTSLVAGDDAFARAAIRDAVRIERDPGDPTGVASPAWAAGITCVDEYLDEHLQRLVDDAEEVAWEEAEGDVPALPRMSDAWLRVTARVLGASPPPARLALQAALDCVAVCFRDLPEDQRRAAAVLADGMTVERAMAVEPADLKDREDLLLQVVEVAATFESALKDVW